MRKLSLIVVTVVMGLVLSRAGAKDQPTTKPTKAPEFSLQDQNGEVVSLSSLAGKVVVLEWINPECPFVIRHYNQNTMQTLADAYRSKDVVWLAINSTASATNDSNKQWVSKHNLSYPILNDSSGRVGHAYGATNTPNMFVIDTQGNIVYRGAIDNDPSGKMKDAKISYVQKALDEVLSGATVSLAETKAYGCSVKYAK